MVNNKINEMIIGCLNTLDLIAFLKLNRNTIKIRTEKVRYLIDKTISSILVLMINGKIETIIAINITDRFFLKEKLYKENIYLNYNIKQI
tara:strand:+ start:329 stop:598 length:270 start_codon:yes stop_codon:yes gene_type:complete